MLLLLRANGSHEGYWGHQGTTAPPTMPLVEASAARASELARLKMPSLDLLLHLQITSLLAHLLFLRANGGTEHATALSDTFGTEAFVAAALVTQVPDEFIQDVKDLFPNDRQLQSGTAPADPCVQGCSHHQEPSGAKGFLATCCCGHSAFIVADQGPDCFTEGVKEVCPDNTQLQTGTLA